MSQWPPTTQLTYKPESAHDGWSALMASDAQFLIAFRCGRVAKNMKAPGSRPDGVTKRPY